MTQIQLMALIWFLSALLVAGLCIGIPVVRKMRRHSGPAYKPDRSKPKGAAAAPVAASRLNRISARPID